MSFAGGMGEVYEARDTRLDRFLVGESAEQAASPPRTPVVNRPAGLAR